MDKNDMPFLSVAEISKLIGSREVSPVEVVEAHQEAAHVE